MKIVIDISEETINRVKSDQISVMTDISKLIKNSTPLTESVDCVSRKAVLDIFSDVHPLDYNANAYVNQIKNLPSVQPKREPCEAKCLDCLLTKKVVIKDNITNGDVIKAVFPNTNIKYWAEYSTYNVEFPNDNDVKHFSYDWWNAPYKAEREDKECVTSANS